VKHREYVEAARLLGAGTFRVLGKEILPGVIRPVLAYAVVVIAGLMVAEASVSFLGLGVVPPTPSWGGMIAAGQNQLNSHPELVLVPAAVLFLTVFSFGVIGRWLRERNATR
jgi:peptide/nickel transport system permease protein